MCYNYYTISNDLLQAKRKRKLYPLKFHFQQKNDLSP